MKTIITQNRSLIPACDVDIDKFKEIVRETCDIEKIGGYKIGFYLGLKYGLPKIAEIAKKFTKKPLIYDHQKAGTDIPDTGKLFARVCKDSGIDAVILFPQAGPETEKAWIEACAEIDLGVIVGGLMTHKGYVKSDGGYLDDDAILNMYLTAAKMGVKDFVVPGNKPEKIAEIKKVLEENNTSPVFYSPGFLSQGGEIKESAKSAGDCFHAIVGRAIYTSEKIRETATHLSANL